mmetsp:Transcript_11648/g.19895  ORF Transcript_11648/g.19895 Transcript_11648/m.19895 type:complete len:363 (+) Transcript_11648:1000-2088(+)
MLAKLRGVAVDILESKSADTSLEGRLRPGVHSGASLRTMRACSHTESAWVYHGDLRCFFVKRSLIHAELMVMTLQIHRSLATYPATAVHSQQTYAVISHPEEISLSHADAGVLAARSCEVDPIEPAVAVESGAAFPYGGLAVLADFDAGVGSGFGGGCPGAAEASFEICCSDGHRVEKYECGFRRVPSRAASSRRGPGLFCLVHLLRLLDVETHADGPVSAAVDRAPPQTRPSHDPQAGAARRRDARAGLVAHQPPASDHRRPKLRRSPRAPPGRPPGGSRGPLRPAGTEPLRRRRHAAPRAGRVAPAFALCLLRWRRRTGRARIPRDSDPPLSCTVVFPYPSTALLPCTITLVPVLYESHA